MKDQDRFIAWLAISISIVILASVFIFFMPTIDKILGLNLFLFLFLVPIGISIFYLTGIESISVGLIVTGLSIYIVVLPKWLLMPYSVWPKEKSVYEYLIYIAAPLLNKGIIWQLVAFLILSIWAGILASQIRQIIVKRDDSCEQMRDIREQLEEERAQFFTQSQDYEQNMNRLSSLIITLSDLAKEIPSVLEVDGLFRLVMDKASELFSAKHCAVFYVDHVFNKLVYACSMGYNQEVLMGFGLTADEESGIPGWCAKHGKFLSLKDVQKDPHMIDIERQNKFPVLFCQPIVQRDKPIAVICVGEVRRELEEKELLRSASLLANLSSIAIENARLMERTKEQAIRDGLTGLYNHRHFYEILELIMKKMVEKEGSALGILLIDIDHFKEFNDTHGHLVGDSILQETAGILKKQTQKDDMAARYGGEEFAIICIRKDTAGIKAVAEDLRRSVERAAFRNGQLELKLTISVGVAFYNVKERPGLPASELVRRADEVLYKAKESGRNKVCVYE